ncbi:MAG: lysylphosphatidylglycerol synthase domain-containing protein [Brumimicrobium sp.]
MFILPRFTWIIPYPIIVVPGSIPRIILSSTIKLNVVFQNLKVRKSLLWSVKILVFLFVVYIFLQQLTQISFEDFNELAITNVWYIVIAVVLVPINWGLELLKWYFTVKSIDRNVPWSKMVQSLLAGISTGFVTPNRLGNFIGRMLYFKGRNRAILILGTLYGNLSQFIASLIFGVVGFIYVGSIVFDFQSEPYFPIIATLIGAIAILLFVLYPLIPIEKLKWFRKYLNVLAVFRMKAKTIVLPLLILSLVRYLVFVLQFCLLLIAFGAEYSHELIYGLYLHYLIVTFTPTLIFGKLVVRETVGLLVLGSFIANPTIIIAASLALWLMNLGLPALTGLFFLLKVKYAKHD